MQIWQSQIVASSGGSCCALNEVCGLTVKTDDLRMKWTKRLFQKSSSIDKFRYAGTDAKRLGPTIPQGLPCLLAVKRDVMKIYFLLMRVLESSRTWEFPSLEQTSKVNIAWSSNWSKPSMKLSISVRSFETKKFVIFPGSLFIYLTFYGFLRWHFVTDLTKCFLVGLFPPSVPWETNLQDGIYKIGGQNRNKIVANVKSPNQEPRTFRIILEHENNFNNYEKHT